MLDEPRTVSRNARRSAVRTDRSSRQSPPGRRPTRERQPLAERLGLRVVARVGRDALAEQAGRRRSSARAGSAARAARPAAAPSRAAARLNSSTVSSSPTTASARRRAPTRRRWRRRPCRRCARRPACRAARARRSRPSTARGSAGASTGASSRVVGRRRDVDARAVGEHGDVRHGRGIDVRGGEHAVRRRVAGRRRDVEAGIARQREFDRRTGERPADRLRVGSARDAVQQCGGFFLDGGVG